MNVQTMRLQYKRNVLGVLNRNSIIYILGIVDHKICHEEKIRKAGKININNYLRMA